MVKLSCAEIPLPGTKRTIRGEINSLNFYRPIVTEEYIRKEDTETTKKRLFFVYFQWVLIILIGALAGLLTSLHLVFTDKIKTFKRDLLKYLRHTNPEDNYLYLWWYWTIWTAIPTCLTSLFVVHVQPLAEGTGIETIIAFLNGVAIPRFGQLQPTIMKYFCILLVSIANLPGGCQEPLVHVVTMLGVLLTKVRIPFTDLYPLKNDVSQRDLAAVSCGAGIAAVFGTPIGGTLFALELMTYWSPTITFYIFISSLCAACINRTLTIYYLDVLGIAKFEHISFFHPLQEDITNFSQAEIPIYILMGLCIGCCGAIWNYVQVYLNAFRRRYIKLKWLKVLEAVMFAVLLCLASYLIVVERHDACFPMYRFGKDNQTTKEICADEENRVSSFLFEGHSEVFNTILSLEEGFVNVTLLFYFLGIYEAAVFQLGLHVPTGIIVPTMISGALMGRLMASLLRIIIPSSSDWAHVGKMAYLGAVAHTTGVTHLRFSLGVIMIEAIGDPLFGLPVFLIIFIINWVVEFFNYPIFHLLIKFKGIPVLDPEFMPLTPGLIAEDVMAKEVVCLPLVISPKVLFEFVQIFGHLGFPVVNSKNVIKAFDGTGTKTVGFIYRNDIYRLLNPDVSDRVSSASVRRITSYKESMPDISFSYLMDPNPLKIRKNMSLSRAYELFVTLGLQHLLVVDNQNYLVGLITRKDLAAVRFEMLFFNARLSRARIVYNKEED